MISGKIHLGIWHLEIILLKAVMFYMLSMLTWYNKHLSALSHLIIIINIIPNLQIREKLKLVREYKGNTKNYLTGPNLYFTIQYPVSRYHFLPFVKTDFLIDILIIYLSQVIDKTHLNSMQLNYWMHYLFQRIGWYLSL